MTMIIRYKNERACREDDWKFIPAEVYAKNDWTHAIKL